MYEKTTWTLFGNSTTFLKDGVTIARKPEGEAISLTLASNGYIKIPSAVRMTRAQGFRYWTRHFPNRSMWELPEIMQEAVCLDPHEEQEICVSFDRFGNVCKTER